MDGQRNIDGPPTMGGRFVPLGPAGEGANCLVWRARDLRLGEVVAMKVLRRISPQGLYRLKREFRLLSAVQHPNLVAYLELIRHEDDWVITMELIDGIDLLSWVRGEDAARASEVRTNLAARGVMQQMSQRQSATSSILPAEPLQAGELPNLDRLRLAFSQIADGVRQLHDTDQVHRDLKPSNVLVTPGGRVVVLDFGLVAEVDPEFTPGTAEAVIAGSAAYMAPEQAQVWDLTPACDAYSLGVMLYEVLTGRWPFEGSVYDILSAKQHIAPTPPKVLIPQCPDDLNDLCMALLSRDPEERPSLSETRRILRGQPSSSRHLSRVGLMHRDDALSAMMGTFSSAAAGRGGVVVLKGPGGVGRTAVLREFVRVVRRTGPVYTLKSRCLPWEDVPLPALDGWVDNLTRVLQRLDFHAVQAELADSELAFAGTLFPVLQRVQALGVDFVDVGERQPAEVLERAIGALRTLLGRLADDAPVVLLLDDAHQATIADSEAIAALLSDAVDRAVLLVLCVCTDRRSTPVNWLLSDLRRLGFAPSLVDLQPLSSGQAHSLARAWVEDGLKDGVVEQMAALSGGLPGRLQTLCRAAGGQEPIDPVADPVLGEQVRRLPDEARRLVDILSVARDPIPLPAALAAADIREDALSVVSTLLALGLAREPLNRDNQLEVAGASLADWILAPLPVPEMRRIHASLARALEAHGTIDLAVIVDHYVAAGESERAARLARSAGRQALEAQRSGEAADHFQRALGLGDWDDQETSALRKRRAEALVRAGRCADAAEALVEVVGTSEDPLEHRIEQVVCQVLAGQVAEGRSALDGLLRDVGVSSPGGGALGSAVSMLRRVWRATDVDPVAAADTCAGAARLFSFIDPQAAVSFHPHRLRLAVASGEASAALQARADGIEISALMNLDWTRDWESLRADVREAGAGVIAARTVAAAGRAALASGGLRAALLRSGQAAEMLLHTGGPGWEALRARVVAVQAMALTGELRQMAARVGILQDEVFRVDLPLLALELAVGPVLWLRLADGRLDNGLALLDYWCGRCSEVPVAQRVRVGMARAWLVVASGDLTRAQRIWRARSRLGVRPDIDAYCLQVEAVIGLSRAMRGEHDALPGVRRAAESLRGASLPWAFAFGYAVSAAVSAIEGQPWRPMAEAAVEALQQADAHLIATLLRRRIVQSTGQSSLAQDHKLVQLGVSDPDAMLARVLPGLEATVPNAP